MNIKKLAIIALSLCMIAAIAITGTIAYFTDTEAEKNVFTVGNIDIVLNEEYDPFKPLLPSDDQEFAVDKKVTVGNVGNSDAYARVWFAYEDTQDVGAMAKLLFSEPYAMHGVAKEDMEDNYVIPGGNGDWLQITDGETVYTVGYVTLSEAIPAGEETDPILQKLQIKAGADNAWKKIVGENYDLLVMVQSSQAIDSDTTATESLNTAYGFEPVATEDDKIAEMFSKALGITFTKFDYKSYAENNIELWTEADTAWDAHKNHPEAETQDLKGETLIVGQE